MKTLIHRLAITLVIFFGAQAASAAGLLLTYAVSEEKEINDGKSAPRKETNAYTQTILLDENVLAIQHDQNERIVYDFAKNRAFSIDLKAGTARDYPLCYLVDFFEIELANREYLGAAMRSAKIDAIAAQFDRFAIESALRIESRSISNPSPIPKIETVKTGDTLEFSHDGKVVVRFVPAAAPLPDALKPRLATLLAYNFAIHPQIRRAIAATGTIPDEIVFTANTPGVTTVTTSHLISDKTTGIDAFNQAVVGLKPAPAAGDPFNELVEILHTAERTVQRPTREAAMAFAKQAIADQHALDALLALVEYTLQSGEPVTAELSQYREIFSKDADVQTYMRANQQNSKAATEASLALNATLDRAKFKKAHMLELERANLLERLGRISEARQAYFAVLKANPFHAGALHDLGLLYSRAFQPIQAWTCWDIAFRIYPDHRMMKEIKLREQQLRDHHPDFF